MRNNLAILALVLLVSMPFAADARGGGFSGGRGFSGGGMRSGGFSAPRVSAPIRVSAPSRAPTVNSRASGFQNARTINAATPRVPTSYAAQHTTVNNYGGYGGGGGGFFSGYMMGSFMHPFGFGYGMYGGGYGYGVDAYGGAYYPSIGAMLMSWVLSLVFLIIVIALFVWFIKWCVRNDYDY